MINFKNLLKKFNRKQNQNIDTVKNVIISGYEEFLKRRPLESEMKLWLDFFSGSNYKTLYRLNRIKPLITNLTNPNENFENIIHKLLNQGQINEINKIRTDGQIASNADMFALKYFLCEAFKINLINNGYINKKKIVYFHIPKCAGNSVMKYFEYALGSNNILRFNVNGFLPDEDGDKWINEWNNLFNYAEFISIAHCGFDTCRKISGNSQIVAFFREPKARILSAYYYFKSFKRSYISSLPQNRRDAIVLNIAKTNNLLNFLQNKNFCLLNNIDNTLARCLTGFFLKNNEKAADSNYDKLHENHEKTIEIALKNLEKINIIGIIENFDTSLKFISETLALKEPEINYYKENVTEKNYDENSIFEKIEKEPATNEIKKELEKFTELDKIIYAYALKKFNKQIKPL